MPQVIRCYKYLTDRNVWHYKFKLTHTHTWHTHTWHTHTRHTHTHMYNYNEFIREVVSLKQNNHLSLVNVCAIY